MTSSDISYVNTESWRNRADRSVSQFTGTNSKHHTALIDGLYRTHCNGGHASYLYCADTNRRYLDYICGLGTNLMGYGNDKISQHLQKYLFTGFSHSIPNLLEVEASEKLKEIFPFVDLFKFLKTGSEACSAAVKIARHRTGRTAIISEGYHGWHDSFASLMPLKGMGRRLEDNNFCSMWECLVNGKLAPPPNCAAIIVEPISTDDSKERIDFLKYLREYCDENEMYLIFDEVITGLRYKKYGVSNCYGIEPDLIVLGKAIANGLPLAAVGGKRSAMQDRDWFVSSSYSGEILSLASCWKVIDLLQKDSSYNLDRLQTNGKEFIDTFNAMPSDVKIEGYPTRGVFTGSELSKGLFLQEMAKLDVLFGPSFFYNFDHIEHNDELITTNTTNNRTIFFKSFIKSSSNS